jgi:acyl phosphate:glycerol-3-phosphate acyltransferase
VTIAGYILSAIAAYFVGSLPTGFLVAKARGIDIRTVGSGNIGATNVFRILGKKAGIAVLLIDGLKGFVACRFLSTLPLQFVGGDPVILMVVTGVAAVLGHNYTVWLKFKGGKGIATSAGVLAALNPPAFLLILMTWAVVFLLTRYVSLASVAAALVLPFSFILTDAGPLLTTVSIVLSLLAIYKHRPNIKRLLQGSEHRFGEKKPTP